VAASSVSAAKAGVLIVATPTKSCDAVADSPLFVTGVSVGGCCLSALVLACVNAAPAGIAWVKGAVIMFKGVAAAAVGCISGTDSTSPVTESTWPVKDIIDTMSGTAELCTWVGCDVRTRIGFEVLAWMGG